MGDQKTVITPQKQPKSNNIQYKNQNFRQIQTITKQIICCVNYTGKQLVNLILTLTDEDFYSHNEPVYMIYDSPTALLLTFLSNV